MMFPTTFGTCTISSKVRASARVPIVGTQGLMKICRSGCACAMLVVVVMVVVV
jgi:hypothetical protein